MCTYMFCTYNSCMLNEVSVFVPSLCAVDVCDEAESKESGYYTFKLHARKSSIVLSAKTAEEVNEWVTALQDVIDSCPTIQTITERVILEIIVRVTSLRSFLFLWRATTLYVGHPRCKCMYIRR